jgi:hypothetical protein
VRAEVADALARLREAGALLRERSAHSRIEALAGVLESWRDAGSPWRKELADRLPGATGFSPEVVREGLALGLEDWSGAALHALVSRELPGLAPDHGRLVVSGFPTTAVVCAGAIPMPTLLQILAPLALGSAVLAKPASHDPVTPGLVARSVAAHDPLLGACIELAPFPHGDADALDAFLAADCVVATGSDEAVASIAARVAPPRRTVCYGHRISLALFGPQVCEGAALRSAARGLALDVALWDQLGCLSPVSVHVVGARRGGATRVAEALGAELEALEARLPRGRIDLAAAAATARERAEAEMRRAASPATGRSVRVHTGNAWTVVEEADARPRPSPLHRFLRVHPAADLGTAVESLRPLSSHLAAVAVAGFERGDRALAHALADLGASRVCAPGRMQAPPLGWHHDGLGVLAPLARSTDVEID